MCKRGRGRDERSNRQIIRLALLFLLTISPFTPLHLLPVFPSLFSASHAAAQSDEVEVLIRKIEARYGRMRGLAAEFEQTYSAPGARVRRESGRLFLARPRRMRWEYTGKLFIVNGRDVWFYVPADREATHADAGAISDERFPFLFLLGQTNLRRAFKSITLVENSGTTNTRALRLVPGNNSGGLSEIFLEVTADGQIVKVKLVDTAGAFSEISLRDVRENYVAPPEAFQFSPPPGVNVRKQ